MATQSIILAWRIPWTEESGGLQSLGSQRVRSHLALRHTHTDTKSPGILPPIVCFCVNQASKTIGWRSWSSIIGCR